MHLAHALFFCPYSNHDRTIIGSSFGFQGRIVPDAPFPLILTTVIGSIFGALQRVRLPIPEDDD